jgi:hypothetical protein
MGMVEVQMDWTGNRLSRFVPGDIRIISTLSP